MRYKNILPFFIWFIASGIGLWIVFTNGKINTELTFFLPSPNKEINQLLTYQLREGNASQIILIGITGSSPNELARTNKKLASILRRSDKFHTIMNGEVDISQKDIDSFLRYRYLLSPSVNKKMFSSKGIQESLKEKIKRLNSSFFNLEKMYLRNDPTGELLKITKQSGPKGPPLKYGVWFSRDHKLSLLMVRMKAQSQENDAQEKTIDFIQKQFHDTKTNSSLRLVMSGTPVFTVLARRRIRHELTILSVLGVILNSFVVLWFFHSLLVLILIVLPLVTAILLSTAVILYLFGTIHGITLVFGITIIGVGIDYPIHIISHLLGNIQTRQSLNSISRTLALGVFTTCFGYLAMLMTGIKGLIQISIFSITGLLVAVLVSRFLLPPVVSHLSSVRNINISINKSRWIISLVKRFRWVPYFLLIIMGGALTITNEPTWNDDLAKLSPFPDFRINLDRKLRSEIGVLQYQKFIVLIKNSVEDVLVASERIKPKLDRLIIRGKLQGYKMAAQFLPSKKTQRTRQKILPNQTTLQNNLALALVDLPFKKDIFAPFLKDVQESKSLPLIGLNTITIPTIKSTLESLIYNYNSKWIGLIALEGEFETKEIRKIVQSMPTKTLYFLDLKTQTEQLMSATRRESLSWFYVGAILILLVLAAEFRDLSKVIRIILPVILSIIIVACWIILVGNGITIIHLISLLLVAGVGIDYGVFFQRHFSGYDEQFKTLRSVIVCNLTTFISFFLLVFSGSRVLYFIGSTVSIGVFSCMLISIFINAHFIQDSSGKFK